MKFCFPRLLGVVAILIGCSRSEAGQQNRTRPPAPDDSGTTSAKLDSSGVTPAEIALGDSVFNGLDGSGICATCHGQNGVGTGAAPTLNDNNWINGDGSRGYIEGTVYQGVPNPTQHPLPMPAFGHTLTERQLHAVAAYVFALSHGGVRKR
ncbi:MAG TPA: c-type cytochrome [Gemmatimonadales bacterium]|nr:c-type cytochrome [Gemmatimonadales bacterium]